MSTERLDGIRRLLAVRLDNIGDVVLAGPALRALARALPGAEITLLASRAGAEVAPLLPWVDDLIVARPVWQDVSGALPFDPQRELAFVASLRERAFDAAFVFTSFSQSGEVPGYVAYLAGISTRVGHAQLFSGGVFSHPVDPPPASIHQAERNLALVEATLGPVEDRLLELRVPAEARFRARAALGEAGLDADEPFFVVAPGASCAARRYDLERMGQAAARLSAESGLAAVVVGHAREAALVERLLAAAGGGVDRQRARVVSLAGRTDLQALAALVEAAALLVANDSGPMHLADAFGAPQVVLYAGTDLESQWRPRRSPHVLLRRPTPCSPCYLFDCPYDNACLDIPPREVVDEALQLLSRQAQARPTRVAASPA